MSMLGKVLAVLNLLAAIAFVVLAIMDYGQRRTLAYATYRWDLDIQGFPESAKSDDIDALDEPALKKFNAAGEALGGKPIKTQEDELARVKNKLTEMITGSASVKVGALELSTTLQKHAWALRPLATTFRRRDGLTRLMASKEPSLQEMTDVIIPQVFDKEEEKALLTQKNDPAALRAAMDTLLAAELSATTASPAAPRTKDEMRVMIAHLLFAFNEALHDAETDADQAKLAFIDSRAFGRTLDIIGLEAADKEVTIQAENLRRMVYEVDQAITHDRDQFAAKFGLGLQRNMDLKQEFVRVVNGRQGKEAELQKQRAFRDAQDLARRNVRGQVDEANKTTQQTLAQMTEQEQRIHKQQRDLRDATEKVKAMEKVLRDLENKASAKGEAQ